MNKKIIIISTLTVLMLLILPTATALQNTNGSYQTEPLPTLEEIQQMDLNTIIDYLLKLTTHNPDIQTQLIQQQNDETFQDLEDITNNNQTLIQKIWSSILNYRFFRLYLSFWITLYTQSDFSLYRTIHWAIETLEWLQLGIIIGIINIPDYTPPETPTILFDQNNENHTLTVTYISDENIYWEDIENIGSGTCDTLPTGNITIGDMITNCTGIIVLRYTITDSILGVFEFD